MMTWQKAGDGVSGHSEVVLQTWVVVPSSQVPEYHSQLQHWFQWSSELGVLLLEARRQPVEQELEHVWRHAQVVSERLHIIVPELDH